MATAVPWELIRIRELVLQDPVALGKWTTVVDYIVRSSAADVRRIKELFNRDKNYEEAVLQSLTIWNEQRKNPDRTELDLDLVELLKSHGLHALANKIVSEDLASALAALSVSEATQNQATTRGGICFNVDPVPSHFAGRICELGELHSMLLSIGNGDRKMVSIWGDHGVGKSTLARKYAHEHKEFYNGNVVWISARTEDTRSASLSRVLARVVPLLPDVHDEKYVPRSQIFAKLYNGFKNKRLKFLVIFDNAKDLESVEDCMPPKLNEHAYILLTTTWSPDSKEKCVELKELPLVDIVSLVRSKTPEISSSNAMQLAKILPHRPLELLAALCYLHDSATRPLGDDRIPEGLQVLLALLELEQSQQSDRDRRKQTFWHFFSGIGRLMAWMAVKDKICANRHGNHAIRLTYVLPLLNPDHISVNFLVNILGEETLPALQILKQYSIVGLLEDADADIVAGICADIVLVRIHYKVQRAIWWNMDNVIKSDEGRLEYYNTLKLLATTLSKGIKHENFTVKRECTSHAVHLVLNYESQLRQHGFDLSTIEAMGDFYSSLSHNLYVYGAPTLARKVGKRARSN